MSEPVRIGVVGYGLGGRSFHAPLIASAPELELVGVVTTNPERRAQLATDHPGVAALDDLAALVAAGAEAVAISSTTGTQTGSGHQPRSPHCWARARSRRRPARPPGCVSTAAETVKATRPSGTS